VVVSGTGFATDSKETAFGTYRTAPYSWSGCFGEGEIWSLLGIK